MITRKELTDKIITIVEGYILEEDMPDEIDFELDLTNDLGINSMHVIDIIIDIENEFDIIIKDEEIQKMSTLNKVIDVIQAKVQENK